MWDRHYHVTLLSDKHLRSLLVELGLESDMEWVETRTGFYTDGRLHSLSNSLEFLTFPPLNLFEKGSSRVHYPVCLTAERLEEAGEDSSGGLVAASLGEAIL